MCVWYVCRGLLSILMECASGQMLALSAAHIIHTASQDVTAPGSRKSGGLTDMQIGSCSGNIITLPSTPGDATKNAAASLYFRGNQIATNSIGRPD